MLQIKDWDKHFENNRTRELKFMAWVPLPNKMDGDGYTELLDHPNGPSHYAAWTACVLVASKCDPRGTLVREGRKPHDTASLARITRIPQSVYEEAIPRLIEIGWLVDATQPAVNVSEIPQDHAVSPQASAEIPQRGAESSVPFRSVPVFSEEVSNSSIVQPGTNGRFHPPTVEEVAAYCLSRNNNLNAQEFVDYYEVRSWKPSGSRTQMRDWKAAVRNWEIRSRERQRTLLTAEPESEIEYAN